MPEQYFSLHPAQQDVYMDQLLDIDSPEYNIGGYIILKGALDKAKFHQVIETAPAVFDSFKMRFDLSGTEFVYGYAGGYNSLQLAEQDFSKQDNPEQYAREWMQNSYGTPLPLKKGTLPFEQYLIKISGQEHWFFGKYHHLITDGYGFIVYIQYIARKYHALVSGQEEVFTYPQYHEAAVAANQYYQSEEYQKDGQYWKEKIQVKPEKLLQKKYAFTNHQGKTGTTYSFSLDETERKELESIQLATNAGLQQLTIAALLIYFGKTTDSTEFIFGTPIHKRGSRQLRNTVGMFSGNIPFKGSYNKEQSVAEFLKEISGTQRGDYRHQGYLIGDLSRDLKINASEGYLCEVIVNYEPLEFELNFGEAITASIVRLANEGERNPLQLCWRDYGKQQALELQVQYGYAYFSSEEIGLLAKRILHIIGQFPEKLDQQINSISIIPEQEEQQLLATFNDTKADYPKDKSIIDLFEAQAQKTPDATAVIFEDEELSYKELNERANQLANYLNKKGVTAETLVPVCIERSPDMVTGILGILKAGGAYVPIDPEYPQDRISYMLEDTAAKLVISSKASREKISGSEALTIISLDEDWELIQKEKTENPGTKLSPKQLAYVIYTSGSTGKPKGVMIEHQSLVNYLCNGKTKYINEGSTKAGSFIHLSYTFDASLTGLFMPLLAGKYLVIGANTQVDVFTDKNLEKYAPYDFIKITPSHLGLLPTGFKNADGNWLTGKLVIGGEALRLNQFDAFIKEGINAEIVNEYGPTEATVGCSTYSFNTLLDPGFSQHEVPIGKPISNTRICILSNDNTLSPIGVTGEICIGGDGLARGYLNRKELTKEKFIKDPFSKDKDARLYKTGDLGRWLADGNIEYQGRIDDQVKVRGYRIELGEIESVLEQSGLVKQAVVLAKEDQHGAKRLVGYVVPKGTFDKQKLQEHLGTKLPDYMVPALWVELESFPLTPNGKTDKKALPGPEIKAAEYAAPRNETEAQLAKIWQELLGVELIGINDNFFELGGHSLLAMRIVSAIRMELNVEISIRDLFIYPTIAGLGSHLDQQNKGTLLPSITAEARPEHIPLSFSQERLWFMDKLEGSVQYHLPAVLRLKGKVNREILADTFQAIVNRHEALRTVILEDEEGRGYQHIMLESNWALTFESDKKYQDDKTSLDQHIGQLIKAPFDLSKDYMLRANLIKAGPQEYALVVTMHHIASDGWSVSILVKEVVEIYAALEGDRQPNLPILPIQYADYSIWQRKYLQGEALDKKLDYWTEKLSGVLPLELPTDKVRPSALGVNGANTDISIGNELLSQLQSLGHAQGATLYMTLLSAFNVLLYRYSGQEDICVGTPVAARQQQEIEGLIGFFVNTLALRSYVDGEASFSELLQDVKKTTLDAYAHQDVPFEKVVDAVVKERDMGRNPLFQVMFVLNNTPEVPELRLGDVELSMEPLVNTTTKFDLSLILTETAAGLVGSIEYNIDLYKESTIGWLITHFKELLGSIVSNPDQHVGSLTMLTTREQKQLLFDFNNTESDYPKDKSIISLFEEQAQKAPDATAVIFEDEELSYKELNERSNQLAHYLTKQGITAETLIPICIERSAEMIIGILGILKAGGAYVPIDPEYPQDRISYMLEDTAAKLVISSSRSKEKLQESTATVIVLDTDWELIRKEKATNSNLVIRPEQLAYVIYTSGSTGKPKGVMIEHRSANAFINWSQQEFSNDRFDVAYATTSICFDLSIFELFYPLSIGKPIRILENGLAIGNYLAKDTSILINTVPSVIQSLLNEKADLGNVSVINMAGEPISLAILAGLDTKAISVRNLYGPTEDTTYSTIYQLENNKPVLIGKPIDNSRIYIIDKAQSLVPVSVPGELCIAGEGLARGYLNRPELTAEKFVKDPFSSETGARIYRTGDLARWLEDGNIEYMGRIDDQVKVRGYRIELGEIENVLRQSGLVKQAVVLAKEDKQGTKRLIGYVVPGGDFDKQAILNYLQHKLPDYMIPALWVELESLPLTPNGKIDKKALPDPDYSNLAAGAYIAPRNETEAVLAGIWQELLGAEQVGIYDNFFELGGDSILTIQVVSRMRRSGYDLQPKDIFNHQSIASLSAVIGKQGGNVITGKQGLLNGSFALLPIQNWYLQRAGREISHYNQSVLLSVDKRVGAEALQTAVEQLMMQHDALRLVFEKKGENWQQTYRSGSGQLYQEDLRQISQDTLDNQINTRADAHQRGLLISEGKLIRVVWMQTPASEETNRLLIVIHHLAIDGVSWRILLSDMELLLDGLIRGQQVSLGVKNSSYRQWQAALQKYGESRKLQGQKAYWEQVVSNYAPLQQDKQYTGEVRVKDIASVQVKLGVEKTSQLLHDVPKVYHTEINDLLLAALSASLCEWSANNQVVIGLEGHGRESISADTDNSGTVGWLTSLYPVLLKRTEDAGSQIKEVKEGLRRIPDKGLGYGVLKYMDNAAGLQGSDPWDLVFNYLGQLDNAVRPGSLLNAATEAHGAEIGGEQLADAKLVVNSHILDGELTINWNYSDKHYNKETINKLAVEYVGQLAHLISHCLEQGRPVHTPADYGLSAAVTYRELDTFIEEQYNNDGKKYLIENIYRLSGLQQGMLFHTLYDENLEGYIEQFGCDLIGLNRDALLASWAEVIKRHNILRSAFFYESFSIPVQCVYKDVTMPVEELDFRGMDANALAAAVNAYEAADRVKGFDFKSPPLMRLALIRLDEDRYRMVWTSHHILLDGWSLPILMEEFLNAYELVLSGKAIPDSEEDHFEDYIRYLDQKDQESEENYWRGYLEDINQGTMLPFVKTDADRTRGKGTYESLFLVLDEAKAGRIQAFAQSNRLTVNTVMQGIWAWLLHNYTGEDSVLFGTVVSGRPDDFEGVEHRVGMYVNTLPLRAKFDGDQDVVGWLQKLQTEQVGSRQYQYTSLQDIQQWTGIKNDLFDCLLTFENYPVSKLLASKTWSIKIENAEVWAHSNFPLTIIIRSLEELSINFSYNSELLEETYVSAIRDQFEQVLLQIMDGSADKLSDISLLTPIQEHQLLVEFNDVHVDYPKEKSVVDIFEQHVAKHPDAIAVVFEGQQLSYRALNERANQLAHYLRSKGVKENTLVPLLIERGSDMLVGMLGILKAGAAYVPIDTEFPMDRVSYMLEDTSATVVVTSSESSQKIPFNPILEIIELDEERATLRQLPAERPETNLQADHLAYIIYTSGSTGKPKGVQISHRNLVDYVFGLDNRVELSACQSFALVSSIATDLGNTVLYGSLMTGGALHVFSKNTVSHIEGLHEYFGTHQIDCLKIVPSHWKALAMDGQPLLPAKLIVFGGEALQAGAVEMIRNTGTSCRIVNHYGPTETTIGKLLYKVQEEDQFDQTVPIGKPFSNTQIYVLSKELSLCPIGVQGQLFIAGDGVSRGYVNNDALTNEKFVNNPYGKAGEKMYGTGDRVVYDKAGNIIFIGRVDDQVKIRGYRVEPGEVGRILEESNLVSQAIVLAGEDKQGNKQLTGYIIPNGEYDRAGIQAYLKEQLPDYMVPAHLIALESFPLTANGKIDRKALPAPEGNQTEGGYQAPRNEAEAKLAEIWQDVLEVDQVGITDDFFEIGGHSLLAVRLVSAIRKAFGTELPIADVFDYPTVGQLATRLTEQPSGETLPAVTAGQRPEHIPLSFSQERLWFIDQLEGSAQYNLPSILRLKGKLNLEILEKTIHAVISRHEVLRTVIREGENGQGYQQVMPADRWSLGIAAGAYQEGTAELSSYISGLIRKPFDLSADYMLRAELIKLEEGDHILAVTMHHIASDGWSRAVLVKEVVALYEGYASGKEITLPALPVQYADYAVWQRKYMQEQVLEQKLGYWKQKLDDVATLELPADYSRPLVQRLRGATHQLEIDQALSAQLSALSQSQGATLYMTMLAAFNVLMYRYSGQQDICLGTTVAGRNQQELEGLIGFFINTLALRSQVNGEMPFTELLKEVKNTTLEAYAHQEVPFEKVVDAVVKGRDMGRHPLFQVLFSLRNTPEVPELKLGDLHLSAENQEHTTSRFDIAFMIRETGAGIRGTIEYNTDLYSAERIGAMTAHYCELLQSAVTAPEAPVGKLAMLAAGEQKELQSYGHSESAYPIEATVASLFEQHVAKHPDAIAVVFEGQQLSYRALNERANQLAHYLRSKGVKENTLVPLLIERGSDMLVGMLGILKAGAAYVPIDTEFPMDRVSYMLEDTSATVVVTSSESSQKIPFNPILEIIELDEERATLRQLPAERPETNLQADHLAYIIYTSGSTGKPKGVQISHRNLVDYVFGLDNRVELSACQSFALVSSIATDLGNTVLYGSLMTGGALHVFSKNTVSHIEGLHEYFGTHQIDCLKIVPSHWKALAMDGQPLLPAKLIVFGGEALQAGAVEMIRNTGTGCQIVNHYGPTETTIGKLLYKVQEEDQFDQTVPIGKPFSNTQIYVLSKELSLCPIGVQGQLFIAGDGVSRGYVNNDALTNEKFVNNPYGKAGEKMYGTGDRVVYDKAGNIIFIGRVDDQVKIRGYRVEPGEVGRILEESNLVSQAIVLAGEDKQGNKQLTGYIIPNGEYDRAGIQAYLKEQLPDYMVPAHLIALESFPLTANGKIDRKALPAPEGNQTEGGYQAPRNEAEAKLAEIWQDVLEVDQVGITDDFFEIGGHSLLAVRLVSAIRKAFGTELPIADVFDYPTVGQLATRLTEQPSGETLPAVTAGQRPEHIPLSFSQERLWFIDQLEGSVQYHIPAVLRLKGELKQDVLEKTLKAVISRHEVLRTVVKEHDGQGSQQIMPADSWALTVTEGLAGKEDKATLSAYILSLINKPFDLSADYMLRADLIKLEKDGHILVVTMHHMASDGWSRSILVKEVIALYEGYASGKEASLPALAVQYADYATWQRDYLQGETLDNKVSYWKTKLENVATLQLPTDYGRPLVQSSRGATCSFTVGPELTKKLTSLSHGHGATLYMALLAAFKVLLYRYSGQEDICVGTSVAGRSQQELEGLIGFFINTLALRSQVSGDMRFTDLLKEVKGTTLEAYGHQEVPFEKVVEAVVKGRDMGRNPLFQVLFSLQNTPEVPDLKLGGLELSAENQAHTTTKFDLAFMIKEGGTGIQGTVEYGTDLYKQETIERMIGHYLNLLNAVIAEPQEQAGRLNMLNEQEEQQLLATFNDTKADYPKDKSIIDLFEAQAQKTPDATAVIFEDEELSYKELNERANQLANYLNKKGVTAETLVPVCIERSPDMVTGILGILKAGGAYVPVDPEYPQDRISYMLEDTAAKLVISSKASREKISGSEALTIISLDEDWELIQKEKTENPGTKLSPKQLAYVIYTSGSTGKPKGVMIEHRSANAFINWSRKEFSNDRFDVAYATTSICFDLSIFELFYPLSIGKPIRILENGLAIGNYLAKDTSILINTVPSVIQSLLNEKADLGNVSVINMAGEPISLAILAGLDTKAISVRNLYGPTEDTTYSTIYQLENNKRVLIGKPIDNSRIYIIDKAQSLVPVSVPGELCIAGEGLARGYLNRPELTAEKFVKDPFSSETGARIYRTGDLARWLEDGNIEYMGRIDDQVKVRGYRIELGEIESVLEQSGLVKQAVILAKEDKLGTKRLVGYVIQAGEFDKQAIQEYLRIKLPDYMVPAVWVCLDKLPLTPNGKTDKKALPDPELTDLTTDYVAPRNETETVLAGIWQELLGLERVGIYDNFFELGGHSLLAMRVVSSIRKELSISIPIHMLFQFTSISDLSKYIEIKNVGNIEEESTDEFDLVNI